MSLPRNGDAPGGSEASGETKLLGTTNRSATCALELAAQIKVEHSAAQVAAASAVAHAIRAGELLLQAKAQLPHGAFGSWIRDSCEFSDRTARGYMRLAGLDETKRQRVADMSLRRALAEIAEPAPEESTLDANQRPSATQQPQGTGARFEGLMCWSQQQVDGPIDDFDLDNWECLQSKLRKQIGLDSTTAVLLSLHSTKFPMLRLGDAKELEEALKKLATLIKDDANNPAVVNICPTLSVPRLLEMWTCIKLSAQRDFGIVWKELTQDRKRYNRKGGDELWRKDCEDLCAAFIADCDAKLAGLPCSDELIPADHEMVCGMSGQRTLQIANSAEHPGHCFVAVITNFASGDAVVDGIARPIKKSALRVCVKELGFRMEGALLERRPSAPWPRNIWLAESAA